MNNHLTILVTEHLRLKRLQPSDVAALVNLWCDPQVTEYMGGPRDQTKLLDDFKDAVKDPFAEDYNLWPVEDKKTRNIIGHCGLLEKEVEGINEIELIYVFSTSAWGKGYAKEIGSALLRYAFNDLQLSKLIALINPENEASERVAVRLGMHYEKEIIRPGGHIRKLYSATRD
jgi:ribosomal-protein-alanine N-acetyltransferase